LDHIDTTKDLPNERKIEHNDTTFSIYRKDPFGFWYLNPPTPKYRLPPVLKGAFTTPEGLEEAIKQYIVKTSIVRE